MGRDFNQTVSTYVSADKKFRRKYLLDVNPWAYFRDHGPGHNIIDARWIDTTNGIYIDITALSFLHPKELPDSLECKNWHNYRTLDIYPLRESTFEGAPAMIPYKYQEILRDEYSSAALSRTSCRK
jgi:hypothetical protein